MASFYYVLAQNVPFLSKIKLHSDYFSQIGHFFFSKIYTHILVYFFQFNKGFVIHFFSLKCFISMTFESYVLSSLGNGQLKKKKYATGYARGITFWEKMCNAVSFELRNCVLFLYFCRSSSLGGQFWCFSGSKS